MLTEFLIGVGIAWIVGIPVFMLAFGELLKNEPSLSDMLRMNAEMNPLGMILLSAAIVFWPALLLVHFVSKR